MRATRASLALLLLAAGCDSKATASDPPTGGIRAEQKSKEFESCGTSAHCADDLRCFDQMCQRAARSALGDYFAAVGRNALAQGKAPEAVAAYAVALTHYDNEKIPVPPALDCEYGAALAAGRSNKENAELGARVLHRCVLAVPPASSMRTRAMNSLALLDEVGLDPLLIGGPKLADTYLTKDPQRPALDKLAVTVSANPAPAKTLPLIEAKVAEPDVKRALLACWRELNEASKKDAMTVSISMKGSFVRGEYEDDPLRFVLKFEPPVPVPAGSPEEGADTCVRAIMEPAIKSLKIAESFNTKLTITVK
ncbi:MAG: hypothetical protein AB7T06_14725 [Kofleriaceae bacterium]